MLALCMRVVRTTAMCGWVDQTPNRSLGRTSIVLVFLDFGLLAHPMRLVVCWEVGTLSCLYIGRSPCHCRSRPAGSFTSLDETANERIAEKQQAASLIVENYSSASAKNTSLGPFKIKKTPKGSKPNRRCQLTRPSHSHNAQNLHP
jgi:hypothetical protein